MLTASECSIPTPQLSDQSMSQPNRAEGRQPARRPSNNLDKGMVPSGLGEKARGKRAGASGSSQDDIGVGMVPTAKDRAAGKRHTGVQLNAESQGSESGAEAVKGRRRSLPRLADVDHMTANMSISDTLGKNEEPQPRGRKFVGTRLHDVNHLTTSMMPSKESQEADAQAARTSRKIGGPAYESHLSSGLAPPEQARPLSGKKSFGRRPSDADHLSRGTMMPGAQPEPSKGKRHVRSASEGSTGDMQSVGPLPGFDRDERVMSRKGSFTRPKDNMSVGMVPTAPAPASNKSHSFKPRDNLSTGLIPGA